MIRENMKNNDNIMNNEIKELIEKVNKSGISSIKEVIVQLVAVINDPNSSAKDLQNIIETAKTCKFSILWGMSVLFSSTE